MDDDLWHVRIAPDDVKQLTLEQLDDLFRLEVIEADTLVWQPGMTEWLPLSVVAGLDEEPAEAEQVNIAVSAPPPRPVAPPQQLARTSTAWPPRAAPLTPPPPKPGMQTASSWPPRQNLSAPPPRAVAPVAWSNPPPKPAVAQFASTLPNPYGATVANPVRSAPPPPSAAPRTVVNPLASPVPSFVPSSAPLSTAPLARTEYSRRSSGGGWLVVVALAAGAAVTLYRNDLVYAAARSVGSEATYLKLESALGGPSFGTPRAVEQMAAAAAALTAASDPLARAPATPAPASTSASTSTPSTAATGAEASRPSDTSAPSTPVATSPSNTTSAAEKPAAPRPASAPLHASHAAPAHAAASHASAAPEKTDSMFAAPKKGKKAKGSDYDPLNGSL
jgi:hypothetical protein